ncbi:MAG TPA: hypothetical protein VHX44_03490 [Planctomycetota bacterium]|jgi:hypothetical protein|nr:hypothetical protein [Planctomycetota bacterium]
MRHSILATLAIVGLLCVLTLPLQACLAVATIGVPCLLLLRYAGVLCMYQNSVAKPRLDLSGAIRTQDDLGDSIAHKLLPPFAVRQKAATMPKLLATNGQVMKIKHAPKTAYKRVEATLDDDTFNCEEAGIEVPLSAEDYVVLGQDGAEQVATETGKGIVLSAREAALADILTGAAGETLLAGQITQPDSAENWGESGGKPIDDIAEADSNLTLRVGAGLRWLVISQLDFEKLQVNEQVRAEYRRIVGQTDAKATDRRMSLQALAGVLGVDEILVGSRRKDTANPGQTASWSYIWPEHYALLVRGVVNPSDLTEPAFGRTFIWDEANASLNGSAVIAEDAEQAMTVESYRDENINSDIIRVREYTDLKILNLKACEMIKLPPND